MPQSKRAKNKTRQQSKKRLLAETSQQSDGQLMESAVTEIQPSQPDSAFDKPFPAETHQRFQLLPNEFIKTQNELEEQVAERRERMVYADSIECRVGYNSLLRLLGH